MWIFFALTAAALSSFLPIINKRLLRDASVSLVAFGARALSLPILALVTFLIAPAPSVDAIFFLGVLGSAILNMVATLFSTQALKLADASLVTPLLTFNPLFTVVISLVTLGETPTLRGIAGIALVVAGVYLLEAQATVEGPLQPIFSLLRRPGTLLAIVASFIWAITPVFEKLAIQHTMPQNPPAVALSVATLTAILLLPPMLSKTTTPIQRIFRHKGSFALAAVISGVAPVFGFSAIATGLLGYVTALFKLSALLTVIWSALLLRETGFRQRIVSAVVMVAGGLLVAL